MSLPQFFLDTQVIASESSDVFELLLSSDDAHHVRVLRLTAGEHIAVIDAAKDYFECELVEVSPKLRVRIAQHKQLAIHHMPEVTLILGLSKGDKVDTVIRHATELGIERFIPFSSSRSIVKLDEKKAMQRRQRWLTIAKSAAMQSGQRAIPEVEVLHSFKQLLATLSDFDVVLVCWEEATTGSLSDILHPYKSYQSRVALVVGPEGGLAPKEVESLLEQGSHIHTVTLGEAILRTETAGIVASALVRYECGGLR